MDKAIIDISKVQLPNLSPRMILMGIAAFLGVMLLLGTFYQVQPEEGGQP